MQLEDLVGGPCVVFKNHDVLCFLPRYRLPTQRNQPGRFIHDPMHASQLVASWTTIGLLGGDHALYNQQVLMCCDEACMARLSRLEDFVFIRTKSTLSVWSITDQRLGLVFEVATNSALVRWVGDSCLAIQYDHQSVRVFDRHGASLWVPSFKVACNDAWLVFVEDDFICSMPTRFSSSPARNEPISQSSIKKTRLGGSLAVLASRGNQPDSFVVLMNCQSYSFDAQTHAMHHANLKLESK